MAHPIISELFPKPAAGSEWIELYNPTNADIDLQGWQLWDSLSQPSLLYTFGEFSLESKSCVAIEVGKKLNDTGDSVNLLDTNSNVINSVSYTSAQLDLGYARVELGDQLSYVWQTATPNQCAIQATPPAPSITDTPLDPSPTTNITPSDQISPTVLITKTPTATKTPTPSRTPSPAPTGTSTQTTPSALPPTPATTIQPSSTPIQFILPILPSPNTIVGNQAKKDQATFSASTQTFKTNNIDESTSRLVFFPATNTIMPAVNVIIGGLCIGCVAGIYVWLDWRKHHADEQYFT